MILKDFFCIFQYVDLKNSLISYISYNTVIYKVSFQPIPQKAETLPVISKQL